MASASELTARCRSAGGRLVLVRRPGGHAQPRTGPRLCYVAVAGVDPLLLVGEVDEPSALLSFPLAALSRGDGDGVRGALPRFVPSPPVLLVCTNGRHDVCCAVRGRPVAYAGHAHHPGRVWECSHTGGHRFSPTGVLLPWGRTLARLDAHTVVEVVSEAGSARLPAALLGPRHDRGSSALAPPVQVGESAVRAMLAETDLGALDAEAAGLRLVRVRHRDGREWSVRLSIAEGDARRNSCGEPEEPARTWAATVLPPHA